MYLELSNEINDLGENCKLHGLKTQPRTKICNEINYLARSQYRDWPLVSRIVKCKDRTGNGALPDRTETMTRDIARYKAQQAYRLWLTHAIMTNGVLIDYDARTVTVDGYTFNIAKSWAS